jgi:hypothetical protein
MNSYQELQTFWEDKKIKEDDVEEFINEFDNPTLKIKDLKLFKAIIEWNKKLDEEIDRIKKQRELITNGIFE